MLQPYQIVKTTQTENAPATGQEMTMSTHQLSTGKWINLTIAFTPMTGKAGQTLGLSRLVIFKPSFMPQDETQSFGIYQDGHPVPLPPVIMKQDAPEQGEHTVVEVMTEPIPESSKHLDADNPTGRIAHLNFLFNDGKTNYINILKATGGQTELTTSIWGGVDADYRVTVFVNHQPVKVNGQTDFVMKTYFDKISSFTFTLDTHEFGHLNSLYAVINPVGESYKNEDLWGTKTGSILLINDQNPNNPSSSETPTVQAELPPAPLQEGDSDLTSWLTANNIGGSVFDLQLMEDNKLLALSSGSAYLFDTRNGELLSRAELDLKDKLSKITYSEDYIGVFTAVLKDADGGDDEDGITLERYNSNLEEVDSTDLWNLFDIPGYLNDPSGCALLHSNGKVACENIRTSQILIGNIESREAKVVFDFSNSQIAQDYSYSYVTSLAFAGNDRYLAFTAQLASGSGFGIIDLEQGQLVDFTQWDALNEQIQVTNEGIYFGERSHGPYASALGKMIRVDLDTLQKQDIPFTHNTPRAHESFSVKVSQHGEFFTTVEDKTPVGTEGYTLTTLRVYDAQTMQILREIDFPNSYPEASIDEANRCLYVQNTINNDLKLVRYCF